MVIRHTNVAKDREKLSKVVNFFFSEIKKEITVRTKEDKMKGWDDVDTLDKMHIRLLEYRRRLKDLTHRSVTKKEKGLEVDIAFTVCLIKYLEDINFRQAIENSY